MTESQRQQQLQPALGTIAIVHQQVDEAAAASERDVLVQRDAIAAALEQSGWATVGVACSLNLQELDQTLAALQPAAVFNLVESLGETDSLMSLVPLLLEARDLPFTGSGSHAILLSNDKWRSKQVLRAAALPTADGFHATDTAVPAVCGRYIVKAIAEHASFGLDQDCVQHFESAAQIAAEIERKNQLTGRTHFAERFIEGREFNLSLLTDPGGPICLPVAEIEFQGIPAGQPRIVGYAAKWNEDSIEYLGTPRVFDFPPEDEALIQELQQLAIGCWEVFELAGYARVDFRVDEQGRPWILEVNTNPCLSPDAGFAAALERAGIEYATAIRTIVESALADEKPRARAIE